MCAAARELFLGLYHLVNHVPTHGSNKGHLNWLRQEMVQEKEAERERERERERETDRQTDRQTDRERAKKPTVNEVRNTPSILANQERERERKRNNSK